MEGYKNDDIEVVIDKLVVWEKDEKGVKERVGSGMEEGEGVIMIYEGDRGEVGD